MYVIIYIYIATLYIFFGTAHRDFRRSWHSIEFGPQLVEGHPPKSGPMKSPKVRHVIARHRCKKVGSMKKSGQDA